MKRKIGKLWICFFILVFFMLVLLIVIGTSFISTKPVPFYSESIDFSSLNSANRKIQNEFNYLTGSEIKTNVPRKITFSASEVNALLAMSITSAQTFNSGDKVFSDMTAYFKKGIFYFNASKKIKFYTPFGHFINLNCDFKFNLKNKIIMFRVLSFKLGKIQLPDFVIDYFVNKNQNAIYAVPAVKRILQVIQEINVFDDKIVIIYYPKSLSQELSALLNSNFLIK